MSRFLLILSSIATVIVLIGVLGLESQPSFFFETLTLLFATTAGLFFFLIKAKRERPELFVPLYLATLVVKLLATGSYMVWVVLDDPTGAGANAVFFLAVYLLFTALEIGFLYRLIRR